MGGGQVGVEGEQLGEEQVRVEGVGVGGEQVGGEEEC